MKQLVIFDLDGTLLNTIADLGSATNHALEQMGFPTHNPSVYPMLVGNGISKLIERALPEDARRQRVVEAMRTHFIQYYNDHLWDQSVPYDGIRELLDELTKRGIRTAVASNKYQQATQALVEHFFPEIPWAAVMGQRELVPLKPDPSIVFDILLECPTPKADVLYVGDSGVDMETAYRACVESVGVTWGFRGRSELITSHANHIAETPDDVLSFIG